MTNVRLQNLRDFTVQIRDVNDKVVGTGIAVSIDGKIVTCAHVVEATGIDPRNANGAEVGVYFPQARGGEEKNRRAIVAKHFPDYDDDVVLLQLTGGSSPLAPEQIAVLGMAEFSEGNPFRTYGYSPIGTYPATRGDGIILGTIEPPVDRNLQSDPVQLKSREVAAGMSGAAVLDATRNLVVGVVAERYYPKDAVQDDIGYGVDSKVLTFNPFDFELHGEALELRAAPSPKFDIAQAEAAVFIKEKYSWNSAPSVLTEWTGRDDLLAQITEDWNNPQKHVIGLIGFGGEGKSSLARKWVDSLPPLSGEGSGMGVDGVFWWGFYENRSIDEFLEAALNYLSGGKIDPRQVPSSSLRAQIIGAMLGAGRYLFVLDGLEVLQYQEGDQYGLLQSNDLRDLLTYFARPDNQSFCLITSRAPLLDLMEYTTYTHRDVDRLSEADGILLLERLKVKGSKEQIGRVVSDWDGHALTISLLGSYLAEKYSGDIAHLADIPIPTADEPRYQRVHRVLRRYDEHLTKDEREFLKLFSVFRLPVKETAFEKVFEPLLNKTANADSPILDSQFTESQITNIVNRLVNYRLIRHDEHEQSYTTHPLIRNHYFTLFTKGDINQGKDAHIKIKDYYLSIAGDTPQYPTLDDLKPLIEVVHHACQAGAYDEAFYVFWKNIQRGKSQNVLNYHFGAYGTELSLMFEFFSDNKENQEPKTTKPNYNRFILNEIGFCLKNLGRLREAMPFFERYVKGNIETEDWTNASIGYQNLADLFILLGALEKSAYAAHQALDFARRAEKKQDERNSFKWQAWVEHLLGNLQIASESFAQAEKLEQDIYSQKNIRYLFSERGIQHAHHLRRIGDLDYACRVTEANLQICEQNHWANTINQCHRVFGDLDFDSGNHKSAHEHYESALKIARSISNRTVLIEALLARGRFYAKVAVGAGSPRPNNAHSGSGDPTPTINDSFTDLNETLNYAVEGGYRIYEADIRVALAWAYLANGEKEKAKQSAQRALQMSQEMGYHWGKVDAEEMMNYEG